MGIQVRHGELSRHTEIQQRWEFNQRNWTYGFTGYRRYGIYDQKLWESHKEACGGPFSNYGLRWIKCGRYCGFFSWVALNGRVSVQKLVPCWKITCSTPNPLVDGLWCFRSWDLDCVWQTCRMDAATFLNISTSLRMQFFQDIPFMYRLWFVISYISYWYIPISVNIISHT